MTLRARFVGIIASLLLAVVSLAGPLAPPAAAGYTTLCWGYSGCTSQGMSDAGYGRANGTMYWRMYAGHNCTNYVAYRMVKSGMPNTRPWSGSGNAENWGLAMSSITNQTPTVGSVAWWKQNVWPAGSAGHVAYVEKVVSPTEIIVSQDSWGGNFSWARITKSGSGWPNGFIHFNDVRVSNTAAPAITGIAKVNGVLTATSGSWSPSGVTLAYQWLANGVVIPGATASTFTPAAVHLNKVLKVRVTASKAGYPSASSTSAPTAAVLPGEITNEAPPEVVGTPVVDSTLTITPGVWTPEPDQLVFRWKADGVRIDGASQPTLPVTPELVGKTLSAVTIAKREGFEHVRMPASTDVPVAPGTLQETAPAAITGTAQLGQLLTLQAGSVTPESTATIEWLRGGEPIVGAAGTSYQLIPEDLGKRIAARVTHERPGYTTHQLGTSSTALVRSVSSMALSVVAGERAGRAKVSATVTAPSIDVVTGIVRIRSGGRLLAEVPLVNGSMSKTVAGLPAGKRQVTVRFVRTSTVTTVAQTRTVRVG